MDTADAVRTFRCEKCGGNATATISYQRDGVTRVASECSKCSLQRIVLYDRPEHVPMFFQVVGRTPIESVACDRCGERHLTTELKQAVHVWIDVDHESEPKTRRLELCSTCVDIERCTIDQYGLHRHVTRVTDPDYIVTEQIGPVPSVDKIGHCRCNQQVILKDDSWVNLTWPALAQAWADEQH